MANVWENAVITNKGIALQAKMLAGGKAVKITSVKSGSGSVQSAALMNQTNVSGIKQTLTMKPLQKIDHTVILTAMLTNDGVTSAYDLRQVGFYAEDPDEGEILYMIAQNTEARHVPTEAEVPGYSLIWNFHITLSNGVNFEVNVDPAGYVNEQNLEERLSRLNIATMTGETIVATDSLEASLYGLSVFGKSTQDGTPTPDAPVEIVSVGDGGTLKIDTFNDNLILAPYHEGTSKEMNGVTFTVNEDYSITVNGTATELSFFVLNSAGRSLTLPEGYVKVSNGVGYGENIPNLQADIYVDGTYSSTVQTSSENASVHSYNGNVTVKTIRIAVKAGLTINNVRVYPMMNVGEEAHSYCFGTRQSLQLAVKDGLFGFAVNAEGNYTDRNGQQWICDEIDLVRGVYIQRVKKYSALTFRDAGDSYAINGVRLYTANIDNTDDRTDSKSYLTMCNKMIRNKGILLENKTGYYASYGGLFCRIKDVIDLDTFNELMNGAVFIVQLKTPIEKPLTDAEIEAFRALHTNYPVTTILNDSNAGMIVKYATSEIGVRVAKISERVDVLTKRPVNNNILINSNFIRPVNQRRYKGDVKDQSDYTIDRWRLSAGQSFALTANGIVFNPPQSIGYFVQRLETEYLNEKPVTFSMKIDGKVYSFSSTLRKNGFTESLEVNNGTCRMYLEHDSVNDLFIAGIAIYAGVTPTIEWAKLEYGNVATPYVPRLYMEEFNICERYYMSFNLANAIFVMRDNNRLAFRRDHRLKPRKTPTPLWDDSLSKPVVYVNGNPIENADEWTFEFGNVKRGYTVVYANKANHGLTYADYVSLNGDMVIDSEL